MNISMLTGIVIKPCLLFHFCAPKCFKSWSFNSFFPARFLEELFLAVKFSLGAKQCWLENMMMQPGASCLLHSKLCDCSQVCLFVFVPQCC